MDFFFVMFVNWYFFIFEVVDVWFNINEFLMIGDYIMCMWDVLMKLVDMGFDYSLLFLFYLYIVFGGCFREVYYWDMFFFVFGLVFSNKIDLVYDLIRNFLVI